MDPLTFSPTVPTSVPVLVAGAGPAGLTAAITLARNGIECLLVERRPALSGLPRADSVSTRTMELMRSWGLEDAIRAGGVDVEWKQWVGRTLAAAGAERPTSFPTREQSAVLSPTGPAAVPQDHIEPLLLEYLRTFPSARGRLGTEVTGVDDESDGARVTLRDTASGETRRLHARYVVAADGAHSTVRALVGVGMDGLGRLSRAIGTEFRAPLWDLLGDRRYCIYVVTHPEAGGVFVPAGRGDRWIYGVEQDLADETADEFTEEVATRRIRLGSGLPGLEPRIARIGVFTFAARLAARFRSGSVFLTGDAAHQITPRGGTGMNTAVQSAHDLGWKLAWVLRGWADPDLLDTYEAERRPVAGHNVARSGDPNGSTRSCVQELPADLGGRIPHLWTASRPGVSTLDLLGPGLTLLTTGPAGPWARAAGTVPGPPVVAHEVDALTGRGLGIAAGGALLVRPDGAPAGWWPSGADPSGALREAVRAVTARGRTPGPEPDARALAAAVRTAS